MPRGIIKTIDKGKNDDIVKDSMKLIMDVPIDSSGDHVVHEKPDSYRDMVVVNSSSINFNARGGNRTTATKRKLGTSQSSIRTSQHLNKVI